MSTIAGPQPLAEALGLGVLPGRRRDAFLEQPVDDEVERRGCWAAGSARSGSGRPPAAARRSRSVVRNPSSHAHAGVATGRTRRGWRRRPCRPSGHRRLDRAAPARRSGRPGAAAAGPSAGSTGDRARRRGADSIWIVRSSTCTYCGTRSAVDECRSVHAERRSPRSARRRQPYMPGMLASAVSITAFENARPTLRSSGSFTVIRHCAVAASLRRRVGLARCGSTRVANDCEVVRVVRAGRPERARRRPPPWRRCRGRSARSARSLRIPAELVHRDLQRRRRRLARRRRGCAPGRARPARAGSCRTGRSRRGRGSAGPPISYSSCDVTVPIDTWPPVPSCLPITDEPSAATSAHGKPSRARCPAPR